MTTPPTTGWGATGWGGGPWGGSLGSALHVLGCQAVSENVLRVTFDRALYFSGILDAGDAGDPTNWAVTPVAGTVGYDNAVARAVTVVVVTQPLVAGQLFGAVVDLTTDRPMTPYPARYAAATVGTVLSADKTQSIGPSPLGETPALFKVLNVPDPTAVAPGRDFANPQTLSGATGSTIAQPQLAILGTFGIAPDRDYAIDSRDTSLLKRLQRRLFTRRAGFLHLPNYGVDVLSYSKRLGRADVRAQLAADCESQFSQEPEVAQVRVTTFPEPSAPNLLRLEVVIKKKSGQSAKYAMLLSQV